MYRTRRPQNICKNCGYTWYPRGKSISLYCPNCGSHDTSIFIGLRSALFGLIVVLMGLGFIGRSFLKDKPEAISFDRPSYKSAQLDRQWNQQNPRPTSVNSCMILSRQDETNRGNVGGTGIIHIRRPITRGFAGSEASRGLALFPVSGASSRPWTLILSNPSRKGDKSNF